MKVGDRVRFLNATGGGTVTRIDGKTVYVEDEDGFESPFLQKDVVVVMPAGHEAAVKGSNIMFDQKAFDEGREKVSPPRSPQGGRVGEDRKEGKVGEDEKVGGIDEQFEETEYGDKPTFLLAFEPGNIKRLGDTRFTGVLVNDSNYFLDFTFLKRAKDDRGWELVFQGTVNPNELIDLVIVTHEELPEFGRIALQGVAYKKDKAFSMLPPVNVNRRLDLTKFHKLHCFRESRYFDSQVLEFPLVSGGDAVAQPDVEKDLAKELSKKYKTDTKGKGNEVRKPDIPSATKKLPLVEVDLHIGELLDTLTGMEPKDMLEVQLEEVRKTMRAHQKRIGQKIVFIHGKGEGVLRKAVLDLLKKEYPKAELQDASFREYGFGATLVTVH